MIGFLQGSPLQIESDTLILNVKGVGYELHCSGNTLDDIRGKDVVQLQVYTHIRQDVLQLFGFAHANEKKLFLSLIKVNGIGPKMAVTILSATKTEDILGMIDRGDAKALTKLPKIGKKTAEQIILSLKGKLVLDTDAELKSGFLARNEIVSALVNLGFPMNDVESVVEQMDGKMDLQQGVRLGLQALTSQV